MIQSPRSRSDGFLDIRSRSPNSRSGGRGSGHISGNFLRVVRTDEDARGEREDCDDGNNDYGYEHKDLRGDVEWTTPPWARRLTVRKSGRMPGEDSSPARREAGKSG